MLFHDSIFQIDFKSKKLNVYLLVLSSSPNKRPLKAFSVLTGIAQIYGTVQCLDGALPVPNPPRVPPTHYSEGRDSQRETLKKSPAATRTDVDRARAVQQHLRISLFLKEESLTLYLHHGES